MTSPVTVRSRVERRPTSSTMPSSAPGLDGDVVAHGEPPFEEHEAAREDVGQEPLAGEGDQESTISDAPATVVTFPAPGTCASA